MKSQFGYHLLKLEEIQAGEAKPFESVRAELDSQYRQERAADLFGERQEEMAGALEKGDTDIDKIAKDLGLTRGSIAEFLRGGGAEPLGSSVGPAADRVQRRHVEPGQDRRPGRAGRRSPGAGEGHRRITRPRSNRWRRFTKKSWRC